MEDLLIGLAIFLLVGLPVLVVVLLIWVSRLSGRMKALETQMIGLEAARSRPKAPEATPAGPQAGPWARPAAERTDDKAEIAQVLTEPPAKDATPASEQPAAGSPPPPPSKPTPPKAVVLRAEKVGELVRWIQNNWIYAVAAISLALAGIFMVQYGIEKGFLTPLARVLGALGFGAALIVAGEYIRRRWGDTADAVTAYLPSVFSGAGIVTLFAAILAALHFYALVTPVVALIGLVLVAALAIVLGWFTGPLLAAVGISGAVAAPFLVGGQSNAPEIFYGYFALIALVGLMIDAIRRWAWVTVLTLVLVYGAALMLFGQIGRPEAMMALMTGLVLMAMAVPVLSLFPAQGGATVIEALGKKRARGWPEFPTRVAAGAMAMSVLVLIQLSLEDAGTFWLSLMLLAALFAAVAIWASKAHALEDIAVLPAIGLLTLPVLQGGLYENVYAAFHAFLTAEPGTPMPWDAWYLVALAVLAGLAAAWRSLSGARWPIAWAAGAALVAPLMMVGLEVTWFPARIIGAYPWALTAAVVAVIMAVLAGVFAKRDGDDKRRVALMTLATLAMISFALIIVLSETALTLALLVTVLAATALDRHFDMKPLMWFVHAGVVVAGWRLVIDPGVGWAGNAGYLDLIAGYGGSIALLVATLGLLRQRSRTRAIVVTESAIWTLAAVFANILILRLIDDYTNSSSDSRWGISLSAMVWFTSAANQIWRLQIGGPLAWVRKMLIALYSMLGIALLGASVTLLNPLLGWGGDVLGPVIVNTLFIAYALPAALFAFMAWKFDFLGRVWRLLLIAAAAALAVLWLGLDIRHFWRGAAGMDNPGVTQPELYSYTIAMLMIGAGLLYQAIAGASDHLRRIAMGVIALTVAKVFLWDMSGLMGLMRVFSFLALGLALAGLALLNRWAAAQARENAAEDTPPDADA